MGYKIEFNWALKLKPANGLQEKYKEGEIYEFIKDEARVYPIDQTLDLINNNCDVLAKVVVTEFHVDKEKTKGKYKIIRLYSKEEKEFLTKYWRENFEIGMGKKIDNFNNLKVS